MTTNHENAAGPEVEADDAGAGDGLGSAAEEAMRLVEALRDLVTGPGAEHLATGSAECQLCPFCRLVALLREADAETVGRAAESVVGTIAGIAAVAEPLLRSLVDTAVTATQAATTPTTASPNPAAPTSPTPPTPEDETL